MNHGPRIYNPHYYKLISVQDGPRIAIAWHLYLIKKNKAVFILSLCFVRIVCSLHFVLTGFVRIQSYRAEYIVLLG